MPDPTAPPTPEQLAELLDMSDGIRALGYEMVGQVCLSHLLHRKPHLAEAVIVLLTDAERARIATAARALAQLAEGDDDV